MHLTLITGRWFPPKINFLLNPELKPYQHSDTNKKEEVGTMFNRIAGTYDFLNHFLSGGVDFYWRKKAVKTITANQPHQILDMATGTGDLALEINKRYPSAQILGIDLADKMIEIGESKIKRKGLEKNIRFEVGDSENINRPSNVFDVATVAFGVRNYQNLGKGLTELNRVLKPSGQLVVLEFSMPKNPILSTIYQWYFKNILPQIGRITSKDPAAYDYLFRSVQAFPDGQNFLDILSASGFEKCTCNLLTFGICTIYSGFKKS